MPPLPPLPDLGRTPPPDLLADLRAIRSTVALLNVRGPNWWLLDHAPSEGRRQHGERLKAHEWDRLKQGLSVRLEVLLVGDLLLNGWQLLGRYQWTGEPPRDRLLTDLRLKVGASEQEIERRFQEGVAATDPEPKAAARVQEFLEAEGRSLHRIVTGKRKSFS